MAKGTNRNHHQVSLTDDDELFMKEVSCSNDEDAQATQELLKETIEIYKEDFFTEHHERQLLMAQVTSLRQQVVLLLSELSDAKQQIKSKSKALKRTQQETEKLKQVLFKHKEKLKVECAANTGDDVRTSSSSFSTFSERPVWSCKACTFQNQRTECCEMCGSFKFQRKKENEGELESDRLITVRSKLG